MINIIITSFAVGFLLGIVLTIYAITKSTGLKDHRPSCLKEDGKE